MLDTIRGVAILRLLLVRDRLKTVYRQVVGTLSDNPYNHARCVIDGGMVEVEQPVLIQFSRNELCKTLEMGISFLIHRSPSF